MNNESGVIYLFLGIALLIVAYFIPGAFLTFDHKEGIRLLEERDAAREYRKPAVWYMIILAVAFWPWVDWEKAGTHQNWAMYIKRREEGLDDDDSDGPPASSKEDGKSGD